MKSIGILLIIVEGLNACTAKRTFSEAPVPEKVMVLDSLAHPWGMDFINDDEAFITEKDGNLLRVNLTTKEREIIKGFPEDLFSSLTIQVDKYPPGIYPNSMDGLTMRGNCGILDIKVHPEYVENHQVYISYVAERGDSYALKVIHARVEGDSLTQIKDILVPGPYVPGLWHFGGGLLIKGNHLYITAGERLFYEYFKQGLPIAQDVTDARGKIYRLHLDGSIPQDNPDLGTDAIPGIFAFGIRAAQGITENPKTGDIWFSEHGTNQGDELNVLLPGANYGWPNITSGKWRSEGYKPEALANPVYTAPHHYWLQTVAPTGLTFYRGREFPSWKGNLIVPGLSRGSLWRMVIEEQVVKSAEELFLDDHVRSRKAIQSPDGHLYMLTDEDNGKLFRIINTNTHD